MKKYSLTNKNGTYVSSVPGLFGGHSRLKIYGRLDCKSALCWIEKGFYVHDRVFFLNEQDAIDAGYRPCARCMPVEYQAWKTK